jgi:hypothetical protein
MPLLFLIQSHKDPDQLRRLVRILRKGIPDSVVLISHDRHATPLPRTAFDSDANVHVIQGRGGRGDFDIVDGYLAALRWLRDHKIHYTWVTNLSGQDYPVSSLADFAKEMSGAPHDGFLHHVNALTRTPRDGYDRYYFQYTKLKDSLNLAERAALRFPRVGLERFSETFRINTSYGLMVGRRAEQAPFNAEFRCYAGSYWHTIRRRCAEYLLDFVDTKPDLVAYLRRVLVPDECFVQTVLANHPGFRFVNDNRRYYDMRGARHGHPKVMTEEDLPRFLGSRYVFARKFERSTGSALLDTLDQYALGSATNRPSLEDITPQAAPVAPAL